MHSCISLFAFCIVFSISIIWELWNIKKFFVELRSVKLFSVLTETFIFKRQARKGLDSTRDSLGEVCERLPPLRGVLDELDSCLHVNLFTLPAKRQRARVTVHRDAVFLSFSFSQTSTAQLHSMKPSQHSRPLMSVCVWSVCVWMGHEESLRRSTVHSAQVTRWVCLTLDWPGSLALKAVSRQACFYLPPIFSSSCFPLAFFPGAQLWKDGSQAPGESRSADPGEQAIRQVP